MDNQHENFKELLAQFLTLYEEKLDETESCLYPDIDQLLDVLKENEIPWGVVTNKAVLYAKKLLAKLNIFNDCAVLVCPDHVQNKKPSPEPLLLACKKLKCCPTRSIIFFSCSSVRWYRSSKSNCCCLSSCSSNLSYSSLI